MLVHHFGGDVEVVDDAALDRILALRYGSEASNEFHLSHAASEYPRLWILVRGVVAAMCFFPREGHPGFMSQGNASSTDVEFSIGGLDSGTIGIDSSQIILVDAANRAAREFLVVAALPGSMSWLEL